ncbi:MAG: hypothetical protein GY694_15915 [Gammaproteobacteria bacterium]|nr:hypothetical protein [Gammaproteobacteria bacterium]
MSVSIYYSFESKSDLSKTDHLQQVEENWDKAFNGDPYESWSWDVERLDDSFFYQGSTKLPLDDEEDFQIAFLKALELLSGLRNAIEAIDWSVNLDDIEVPWDETCSCYK